MTTKIGYKVVAVNNVYVNTPRLYSATLFHILCDESVKQQFCTEYKVGEYVEPPQKGTPLFVFGTLNDAIKFRDDTFNSYYKPTQIYKCEYEEVKYKRVPIIETLIKIAEFWKVKNKHKKPTDNFKMHCPNGTICAKRVKLLEKV